MEEQLISTIINTLIEFSIIFEKGCHVKYVYETLFFEKWATCETLLYLLPSCLDQNSRRNFNTRDVVSSYWIPSHLISNVFLPFKDSNEKHSKTLVSKQEWNIESRIPSSTWTISQTTDARWGNRLHCTAENQIPIPNF